MEKPKGVGLLSIHTHQFTQTRHVGRLVYDDEGLGRVVGGEGSQVIETHPPVTSEARPGTSSTSVPR